MTTLAITILRERGLKQTWLAEQLGISQPYLHDLLMGRRGSESLKDWAPRIAEVVGVPVDELFPDLAMDPDGASPKGEA